MRRLFVIAFFAATACAFNRVPDRQFVDGDDIADLEEDAAIALRCPEREIVSRQLTLFVRVVSGCGREQRYAWDDLREQWVLDAVEAR